MRHADILNENKKKGIFNGKYYFQVGNQIKWNFKVKQETIWSMFCERDDNIDSDLKNLLFLN